MRGQTDQTPTLGGEMWSRGAWSQLQHTSRGGDKWVRSNGELMINRGIGKKCGEKSSLGPLPHHESYMKSLGNEPQGKRGTRSTINEAW